MSKRNIGQEIIRGLEEIMAWKRGELKLKIHTIEMPKAVDVPTIRKELGLSQPEFAGLMGVSLGTLRNWEQERREPQGPARALLLVASKQPAAVRAAFNAAKPTPSKGTYKAGARRTAMPRAHEGRVTRASEGS